VILFSGGKDSTLLVHLAVKAFRPASMPFPLLHVDTGHNFEEGLGFRDALVAEHGLRLVVAAVQDYRTGVAAHLGAAAGGRLRHQPQHRRLRDDRSLRGHHAGRRPHR
jgi:3'-phosphoadenosine 5'-phosphosulfate sulfotransferase (PAPS reductase)/FAD synthetase